MNVDIVIVTYRSADSIEGCLDSIPPGHHVVVVENASGDESPRIARERGVFVVDNDENLGFGAAANQGAALGSGDAVLFLNPDARLEPGTIDAMLAVLKEPDVGIVGAQLVYPDGQQQKSVWPYPNPSKRWAEAFGLHRLVPQTGEFVVGACFMIDRVALERLGGFDERYWLYGEEADLCFRAEAAGWRVVLASGARCWHEGGASGRESSELVARHFAYGSDRFVAIHHGRLGLVSFRLASLVGSALRYPALRLLRPTDPRTGVRQRELRRIALAFLRHPLSVPDADIVNARRHLVVLSLEAWDDVWRRNQFLVRELLRLDPGLQVLWVEPPSDPLHELRTTRRPPASAAAALRPLSHEPRVLRFQPRKWLPRRVWPWVDAGLARQVRRAMERAGMPDAVLWVNDSTYAPLVADSRGRAVYDITDDWLEAGVGERERDRQRRLDGALVETADAVVVCSPELARRRSTVRPVHLIPNAVDVDHFRTPQPRPADLPPGRTAVYVGTLHEDRIDVDLVVEAAAANPDASIVLVGPNACRAETTDRLQRCDNVTVLGARPYAAVPGYLQHADVVIVPHVVTSFTQSLDPIKAYECLAVGRPTLSTPVHGFVELGEPVVIASRTDFPTVLCHMLSENQVPPTAGVVPSWADRAQEFAGVLFGGAEPVDGTDARRRLKVVYLDHTALDSGGELALARLLPGLTRVDPHVILATDGPFRERLETQGVTVEILPMDERARDVKRDTVTVRTLPLRTLWLTTVYAWKVSRRLRALRPDIVHTNSLKAALYGGVAARIARVPVVWHVRDRIAEDYLPVPAVRAVRFLARVLPNAIISNSKATRATLGKAGRDTAVAPSPVVYDPIPADFGAPAADEGRPLCVGMIGRLAPWKGQDVFLRAFAAAFPDGPETALIVGGALFGETDHEAALHSLVADLGLGDRVTMTGHVTDVRPFLETMDAVVHASVIPEPFGQVVLEAMAAGRPVIASAAGGPLELVRDGIDGLLVPPGDVTALAVALQQLTSAETRRVMGQNGARGAEAFTPELIGRQVDALYRRLITPCT